MKINAGEIYLASSYEKYSVALSGVRFRQNALLSAGNFQSTWRLLSTG